MHLELSGSKRFQGLDKTRQFCWVELSVGADAAAEVDAEGSDHADGFGDVLGIESAGEEDRDRAVFNNLSAQGPVVDAAGSAQFADGCVGVAGVEQ